MEDFEGEATFFVEETIDVAGFDFEGATPEALVSSGDGLLGDRELDGDIGYTDISEDLDPFTGHRW